MDKTSPSVCHFYCFVNLKGNPKELGLRSSNMWIYPHGNYEKLVQDFYDDPFESPIPSFIAFSSMKDETWNVEGKSNAIVLGVLKKNGLRVGK